MARFLMYDCGTDIDIFAFISRHITKIVTSLVAPSLKNGPTYLIFIVTKKFQFVKFHWILKIPKPKCVSGHSEQLFGLWTPPPPPQAWIMAQADLKLSPLCFRLKHPVNFTSF